MRKKSTKKNIAGVEGFVVNPIRVEDITAQADYDTFTITKTADSIAYTNHLGYSVVTKPYTTNPMDGKATKLSLYEWLDNMIEMHDYLLEHKDEIVDGTDDDDDIKLKYGDIYDVVKMMTEANITKPCYVFSDMAECERETNHVISVLHESMKTLSNITSESLMPEDEKANAEEFGRAKDDDTFVASMGVQ